MKLSANIRKWICQLTVTWFWQNRLDFLCARSHTHTHTRLTACPGLPGWAGTRKVKTNLDFTEARDMGGSDISWAVCKSAPRSRQITMPAPHHSVFTGRTPFLPPNQQHQSTEGKIFCAQWPIIVAGLLGVSAGRVKQSTCSWRETGGTTWSLNSIDHSASRTNNCIHDNCTVLVPWAGHFQC